MTAYEWRLFRVWLVGGTVVMFTALLLIGGLT